MPMSRLLLCAALALLLPAALPAQGEKQGKEKDGDTAKQGKEKEGETVEGRVRKVDPSAHLIHVKPRGKKDPPERMLKVLDSTVFLFAGEGDKGEKRYKGKEVYKDKRLAEGAEVKARLDAKGRLLEVRVTPRKADEK